MKIELLAKFTSRSLDALVEAVEMPSPTEYRSKEKKCWVWNLGGREYRNRGAYGRALIALIHDGVIAVKRPDALRNATCSSGYPLFNVK